MTHARTERRPVVLVAEDDEDILELVRVRLHQSGYATVCARDGEEALRMAAERALDLAVVDVTMPQEDGYNVIRRLRHDARTERLPVILLTARVHDGDIARGFEAGADDCLEKPFSSQELLTRIQALLSRAVAVPDSEISSRRAERPCDRRGYLVRSRLQVRRDG